MQTRIWDHEKAANYQKSADYKDLADQMISTTELMIMIEDSLSVQQTNRNGINMSISISIYILYHEHGHDMYCVLYTFIGYKLPTFGDYMSVASGQIPPRQDNFPPDKFRLGDNCQRLTVSGDNCQRGQL